MGKFMNLLRATFINTLLLLIISSSYAFAGQEIKLTIGGAKVVKMNNTEKVAIGNPDVADVQQINDDELLITGKRSGITSLIVWKKSGRKDISTVNVTIARTAKAMIQVDVQVMEITKKDGLDLGLDWESIIGSGGQLKLFELSSPLESIGTLGRGKLDLALKLMVEKGNAKILAKPKLITLSGKPAKFSSGGEIPVPIVNDNNQVSVSWKSYGVKLNILPIANHMNEITVDIRAEVSDIDYTYLVQGNPAIKTRWASTTIHVKPDTTMIIGGLIQDKMQVSNQGLPILSDIPVLGYLFKSTRYINESSELVIFVTPRIIGGK